MKTRIRLRTVGILALPIALLAGIAGYNTRGMGKNQRPLKTEVKGMKDVGEDLRLLGTSTHSTEIKTASATQKNGEQ